MLMRSISLLGLILRMYDTSEAKSKSASVNVYRTNMYCEMRTVQSQTVYVCKVKDQRSRSGTNSGYLLEEALHTPEC